MDGIALRPWSPADLELLRRGNAPEMTRHLAGPETEQQVIARHERYLRMWREGTARMFAITVDDEAVGGIGWWHTQWRGEPVHETGWFVVPEAQGRGAAAASVALLIDDVRTHGTYRMLTAYPARENTASNALCARAGFTLRATESVRFRGQELTANVWALDLQP